MVPCTSRSARTSANAPTASPMSVSYDVRYSGGHSAMGLGFSIIGGKRKAPCVAQLRRAGTRPACAAGVMACTAKPLSRMPCSSLPAILGMHRQFLPKECVHIHSVVLQIQSSTQCMLNLCLHACRHVCMHGHTDWFGRRLGELDVCALHVYT